MNYQQLNIDIMDFKDSIRQISERAEKLRNGLQTEEATKNALIMPFIQVLGYDVFNPMEVVPEYTCDIGTKKGEKIDYAILKDGEPILLMECKHWNQDLNLHDNQLLRYFHVSKAKFGDTDKRPVIQILHRPGHPQQDGRKTVFGGRHSFPERQSNRGIEKIPQILL
jgi:hypothetical protein